MTNYLHRSTFEILHGNQRNTQSCYSNSNYMAYIIIFPNWAVLDLVHDVPQNPNHAKTAKKF